MAKDIFARLRESPICIKIHATLENLHDSDLFADYPEVWPLELVGLSEERVEGLAHPLEVGRQRRHRERRHPHQPRLGVLR